MSKELQKAVYNCVHEVCTYDNYVMSKTELAGMLAQALFDKCSGATYDQQFVCVKQLAKRTPSTLE